MPLTFSADEVWHLLQNHAIVATILIEYKVHKSKERQISHCYVCGGVLQKIKKTSR